MREPSMIKCDWPDCEEQGTEMNAAAYSNVGGGSSLDLCDRHFIEVQANGLPENLRFPVEPKES